VPKVASFVDLSKETKLLLWNTHQPCRINLVEFPITMHMTILKLKENATMVFLLSLGLQT
jgi:hypothetical protein